MPLTSAAKSAAGAAFPLTSPSTMAVWSGVVFKEVVKVAPDGAGGKKAHGKLGVLVHGRRVGQQAKLDFASHGQCRARVAAPWRLTAW